jgi:hypothetical protein
MSDEKLNLAEIKAECHNIFDMCSFQDGKICKYEKESQKGQFPICTNIDAILDKIKSQVSIKEQQSIYLKKIL